MDKGCKPHEWVANSGRGGEPQFRLNRYMSSQPLMHVMCGKCGARTWLTKAQWSAVRAGDGNGT